MSGVIALYLKHRLHLIWFALCLLLPVMLLHEVLIGPSIIALCVLFLASPTVKDDLRSFSRDKGALALTLVFLVVLASGLWSYDLSEWFVRARVKLQFLALPIAGFAWRHLTKRQLHMLMAVFVLTATASVIGVIINYGLNAGAIHEEMMHAGKLPTPVHHIRYSLLIALASLFAFYLFEARFVVWRQWERYAYVLICVGLAIALHVLSVRSGLLAFYCAAFFLLIRAIVLKRKWVVGVPLIVLLLAAPVIAYYSVGSFRSKIDYTVYDLESFFSGQAHAGFSDSKRIQSILAGLELGNSNPLLGVGYGDVTNELDAVYTHRNLEDHKGTLPHNQFVFFYSASGLIGLLLCVFALIMPFITKKRYQHWPFVAMGILLFSSFLSETTLETQLGAASFIVPIILWMQLQNAEDQSQKV